MKGKELYHDDYVYVYFTMIKVIFKVSTKCFCENSYVLTKRYAYSSYIMLQTNLR